jgi:hypothetical protein
MLCKYPQEVFGTDAIAGDPMFMFSMNQQMKKPVK